MQKLKKSQRLRVIINGVSIFTTAWDVRMGIGDFIRINESAQAALRQLETELGQITGLVSDFGGHQVQIDIRN